MTTTQSILQLPLLNAATRELRKDLKGMAGDDPKATERNINKSTKNVVKYFSRLRVDPKTQAITGASKETIAHAEKWADRVARPFELGLKSGAQAAFVWDKAFSLLVGRGVKADESPVSLRGLSTKNNAHNWTALRQEGLLGMVTRLPSAALGNLVGRCYSDAAKAQYAKDTIKNATIGFNTAIRTATLSGSAAAIMMTGVLVGTGVSALVALVALPKLLLAKTDNGGAQPAAESAPAAKPSETTQADKATPKTAEKTAPKAAAEASPVSPDISQADLDTFSARHAAAAEALQALLPKASTPTDKLAATLERKLHAAEADVKKLRSVAAGKIDYQALGDAIEKVGHAQKAWDEHQASIQDVHSTRVKLASNLDTAQRNFDTANAQISIKPEALKPLLEALQDAQKAVASHNKQYGVPQAPAAISARALKQVTAKLKNLQKSAAYLSEKASARELVGKANVPELTKMRQDYANIKSQWTALHQSKVVASAQLPLDADMTEIMTSTAAEASTHLSEGLKGAEELIKMVPHYAASHKLLKTMLSDLAKAREETRRLTEATDGLSGEALAAADAKVIASRAKEQDCQNGIDATREEVSPEERLYVSTADRLVASRSVIATHEGHAQLLHGRQTPDGIKLLEGYVKLAERIIVYQKLIAQR